MRTYSIRWKRRWWIPWWNKTTKVIGHKYDKDMDRFMFFFEDGSIREVIQWSKCEVSLGQDWVLATKEHMEKQANQPISLAVKTQ